MMKKRFLSFLMAVCMAFALLPVTALAVEENYDTFDYRAYANIYPDLKKAYGYDAEKLYAHYVNYGKAEGRVGTFISGDNPKTGAPIYGLVPGTDTSHTPYTWDGKANVPATLLDPIPPTNTSQLDKWRLEQRTDIHWMSNAKLVAEWNNFETYMTDDRPGSYKTEAVEVWVYTMVPEELNERVGAYLGVYNYEHNLVEHDDIEESIYEDAKNSPAYERAIASDTRILLQWKNRFKDLPAPPADPGKPGQVASNTVGGFTDVFDTDYFAGPVVWAVEQKITSGTGNNRFTPSAECTQAQILTFLWRAAGSPEPESLDAVKYLDDTLYYHKAAAWAVEKGMIHNIYDLDYLPCTRATAVQFMWISAGSPSASAASFSDVPAGAKYAEAVAWAVANGVASGTGDNKFSPDQTCTRGQIATFLYRAFAD